ncbi:protein-disulfide isomerase [Microbacterium endophyticum]|uniref:Protein-disulfide isomerase n=1 Tax=Microbacterium endophyticum TaxID=1526412 RepID=A0A7W4V6L4_9MICO|nr:thioredoxin domain-containing protein [Microbacterium endophyticum]MBB2977180.1 protein-disulfide isomerase [Microbacterium endophyticum]NIK36034.1 protein-disulfide isomerase [Microbacterium endophyticum]
MTHRLFPRRIGAAVLALTTALSLAACTSSTDPEASAPASTAMSALAMDGIIVGSGDVEIEMWGDPSCPHCAELDKAIGSDLADFVAAGDVTMTLHPMTYVSEKRGDTTDYSTRASAVLFAVADAGETDAVLPLYSLIQANQVSESGSPSDDDLVQYAAQAGAAADLSTAIADFSATATTSNDYWLGREIPGTTEVIDHVPTLVINGNVFEVREDGTDAARFTAAVEQARA